MSNDDLNDGATLTVGDLAARTGVAAGTLRMWEQRHGFPEPARLPSGHRRYRESDVAAVRRVLAARERGVRLEQAVAEAHTLRRVGDSVYSLLRTRHPELMPHQMSKRTLQSLSHAIEDEYCATNDRRRILGGFQTMSFFAGAALRWRRLAEMSRSAVVFAEDVDHEMEVPGRIRHVPIDAGSRSRREWFLVCESGTMPVVMAAWELPGQDRTPDRQRRFEVTWSLDPAVVSDSVLACTEIAAAAGYEIEGPDPALAGAAKVTSAGLFLRAVSYIDADRQR
ncbi:DICT sensory domain-containing protein [Nocardioides sp. AX2bis]|uniref:DICT sensory domain-containing protein n=1 Tax=Nocardioides sp. AX2bis TaxID=2653157 RepID=UPI0012F0F39B|nr:DICT sensory domain-containing protein [Nocardioides sp. AX2bis]VXB53598.1 DNA-binding transcriptional regulator, MerR family [Nocardioides sp. AX2bis]